MVASLSWPRRALPVVRNAGRFPLADRDFQITYRGPTHALHLYDYDGVFRIDGRSIALHPGDLTFSPAGAATQYHLPRAGRHWCVHFSPTEGAEPVSLPVHLHLPAPLRQRVAEAVLRIAGLLARPVGDRALAEVAAGALLQAVLLEVALLAADPPGRRPVGRTAAALAKAEAAIEARLERPLDVEAIAAASGLSRPWLAKAFRAAHGMTLQRWHLHRRIDHARTLLRTTTMPVGRLAERLGFRDAQHLNKQFRRIAGCPPTAYRAWGGDG